MKKLLCSLLILFCAAIPCAFAATTVEFTIDSPDYYIQSGEITQNTALSAPFIKNSRTMVPVRALCEAFGSSVSWDEASRTVTIAKNDTNVSLVIDSDVITVNGEAKTIDCPAEIVDDITFIPLRAVSENLGYYVYYVDAGRQILIDDVAPVLSINGTDIPYNVFANIYAMNSSAIDETAEDAEAMKQYLVNEVYSLLSDVYTMNSDAVNNSVALTEEEKYNLASQIDTIRGEANVLAGPLLKYVQDYEISMKHAENIYNSIEVNEAEIKKYYAENYVCAKHVLISINDTRTEDEALALANEVFDRAIAGEDFDILVDEYGEDPGMVNNTQGYIFTKGQMVAEFEEAAFALNEGEISTPVKTSYGYHIIAKQSLPNDVSTINSLINTSKSTEYQEYLNSLYSDSDMIINLAPEDFISVYGN